jgi:hypothetical protein
MAKDTGIVNIHGKEYQTVAFRINKLREEYKFKYSICTEIIEANEKVVRMKAIIKDITAEGHPIVATGHAEEYRTTGAKQVNTTSALENAETSCIGRALAEFGMGGTEFASADEVSRAISGQKPPSVKAITEQDKLSKLTQRFEQKCGGDMMTAKNLDELVKIKEGLLPLANHHSLSEEAKIACNKILDENFEAYNKVLS